MRKIKKSFILFLAAVAASCIFCVPVFAASTRKGYTISSGNTTVYSDTRLTKKYGTIFGSDEVTVLDVTSTYCKVRYYISGGRTKTGYIPTSKILTQTRGSEGTADQQITTRKRPGGAVYGHVSKNDRVLLLGQRGTYTQIKYPVGSGGFKYAFISTTDAKNHIHSGSSTSTSTSGTAVAEGSYVLHSALDYNKVADAYGRDAVRNGTNIQISDCHRRENQVFHIAPAGGGWYKIICQWGNKAMEVYGGIGGNEKNVGLWDYHEGDGQLWRFISAGNGYYYIQNKLGYYLDIWMGQTANETNIQIYQFNGGANQRWKLERVSGNTSSSAASQADALVNKAKSQIGMKERSAGSDDISYNDWYYGRRVNNRQGFYPWCAVFVSWCAGQTGSLDSVIPKTANTTAMKNGLLTRGGTQHLKGSGYRPVHGDILFFGTNASQHVGIVDYASGNTVYYIDGNNTTTTPHSVKYSSCALNADNLWGFVTPKYQR